MVIEDTLFGVELPMVEVLIELMLLLEPVVGRLLTRELTSTHLLTGNDPVEDLGLREVVLYC